MVVTQSFAENPKIYRRFGMSGHNGVDFRTKFNDTPKGRREIYAVLDGEVAEAGPNYKDLSRGYGIYIRLIHKGGAQTVYGHLNSVRVVKGDKVKAGQVMAISDNTGFSTGAHLHFGYRPVGFDWNNGYKGYVDPAKYFLV